MSQKKSGRRKFLKTTAASIVGVTGGLAATGTASASSTLSGTVSVRSTSRDWEYFVGIREPDPNGPEVEKLPEADAEDELMGRTMAHGHVDEGGVDKYSFGKQITRLTAHHKASGGKLVLMGTEAEFGLSTEIYSEKSFFSYLFTVDNVNGTVEITKGSQADSNDNVSGSIANCFISEGGNDNFIIDGHLNEFVIYDPYSGDFEGLTVDFNRN